MSTPIRQVQSPPRHPNFGPSRMLGLPINDQTKVGAGNSNRTPESPLVMSTPKGQEDLEDSFEWTNTPPSHVACLMSRAGLAEKQPSVRDWPALTGPGSHLLPG